jgi:predicted nucleic-acid-binding Zn-ribbon protein
VVFDCKSCGWEEFVMKRASNVRSAIDLQWKRDGAAQ